MAIKNIYLDLLICNFNNFNNYNDIINNNTKNYEIFFTMNQKVINVFLWHKFLSINKCNLICKRHHLH